MPHGQPHTPPGLLSDTPLNNPDYDYTTILPFRIRNVLDVDELDLDAYETPEIAFPGVVRDVGNAAIRMGQTVRGLRNPNPADMFFDTMEFAPAGLLAGRLAPKGNTLGVFAGPQAETANKGMLAIAEDMAAKGASRDDIWNKTGWFQDVDGKWKFEIDDSKSRVDFGEGLEEIDYGQVEGAAQDVFDFPGLFSLGRGAYPEMSDIRVRAEYEPTMEREGYLGPVNALSDRFDELPEFLPKVPSAYQRRLMQVEAQREELERIARDEFVTKNWTAADRKLSDQEIDALRDEAEKMRTAISELPDSGAVVAYGQDPEMAKSVVLHELQHAIQKRENFGQGGNPRTSYDRAEADLQRKMLENFNGSRIRFAEAVREKRQAAEEYRQLAAVDYVRRMRNITRPNQIFNQSEYYQFSDQLRRELGPPPKRHVDGGRALKKWIADAGEWFASRTPRNAYFDIYAGKDPKELKNALRRAKYRLDKVNTPSLRAAEEAGRQLDILVEAKSIGEFDAYDAYRRLSGEVEARNVQRRMNMTPEERRANPPYRTRRVDEKDIIMSAPGTLPMGLIPTDQNKQPMRPGGIGLFGLYDGGVI